MPERAPARKVRLLDLISGQWMKKEAEAGYVLTTYGEKVVRAWIMATVVSKFLSEDGRYVSVTLDDGTETIRTKAWQTNDQSKSEQDMSFRLLSNLQVGDLVDVIGKVREYGGEIYITPEIVRKVDNPNLQTLRRLEILTKIKNFKPQIDPKEILRQEVLAAIGDGIDYAELLTKLGRPEAEIEPIINELLAEGLCYEPGPGRIKRV